MSVWYRAGTVAVTNGSKTITGTNTQWLNLMFGVMPGTTFYGPDGKPYEIDRVVSDTSLLLITNYSGATASGQVYAIDPTRSGSVASLAAQTSEVLKFSQEQFTQMQTWVTGAANVDVTLKAPSGQTVVVPSWKKISDTVEGQVAAAAVPLPDLWAPLTDDLRMISGYGREVKVGGDVVAKIFGFSRASAATYIGKDGKRKAVAANEPRFEKSGLLLEVQSTNFIPRSAVLETQNIPVQAGSYTLSFHGPGSVTLSGAASGTLVGTGESGRVALTVTAATGGLTLTVSGSCTDAQLEPLPIATSYIPTSGAAVTRAADNMTGPGPGNIPVNAPFSLAAEISVTPVVGVYPVVISMGGLQLEMAELVAGSQRIIPFLNLSPSVPWLQGNDLFGGSKVLAIACDSSGMLLRYGGKTSAGIGGHIESIGDINVSYIGVCHIRNFRIWHRALTGEQIKGVA